MAWIQSLLQELSFPLLAILVTWCDNMGAIALAINPVYHARTKHIEIDVHLIRDRVLEKILMVRYVPSHEQVTDYLTKPLSHSCFNFLREKLGVVYRALPPIV